MILLLLGVLAVAGAAEWYSLEHGLDEMDYSLNIEKRLAEPDEILGIKSTVRNRKRLLVPFLRVEEELPDNATVYESTKGKIEKTEGFYQRSWMEARLYLSGWQQVEIKRKISFSKRGYYLFSDAVLECGDFFGLFEKCMNAPAKQEIVIKPRPERSPDLNRALGGYLGERSVQRFWMEDPIFPAGFREYTGREPFRAISWTQSARNAKMMVKEYDHTAELTCLVLLDISCRNAWEKNLDEATERCFSIARSVCDELEKQGFSYEFVTNAVIEGPLGSISRVLEGRGSLHLDEIMEILGRATSHFGEHLEELLRRAETKRSASKACILISLEESVECADRIQHFRNMIGHEMLVVTPDSV